MANQATDEERLYRSWSGMRKDRYCGVYIHPKFRKLDDFKDWAKQQDYKGKRLTRLNMDFGFTPNNCVFLTHTEIIQRSKTAKLSWPIVREIRERYEDEDITQEELGEIYGIDQSQVSRIVNNLEWVEHHDDVNRLDEDQIDQICQLAEFLDDDEIGKMYDVNPESVPMIVKYNNRKQ